MDRQGEGWLHRVMGNGGVWNLAFQGQGSSLHSLISSHISFVGFGVCSWWVGVGLIRCFTCRLEITCHCHRIGSLPDEVARDIGGPPSSAIEKWRSVWLGSGGLFGR